MATKIVMVAESGGNSLSERRMMGELEALQASREIVTPIFLEDVSSDHLERYFERRFVDELWFFGREMTDRMWKLVDLADRNGVTVVPMSDPMKEALKEWAVRTPDPWIPGHFKAWSLCPVLLAFAIPWYLTGYLGAGGWLATTVGLWEIASLTVHLRIHHKDAAGTAVERLMQENSWWVQITAMIFSGVTLYLAFT